MMKVFVLAAVAGMALEFFDELEREKGWYDDPSQKRDAFVAASDSLSPALDFYAPPRG